MARAAPRAAAPAAWSGYAPAALAAAVPPGLLRRAHADVAAGLACLAARGPAEATAEVDGATVTLRLAGPAASRCSCPARPPCRHILAAALLLSDALAEPEAAVASADPRAEILALTEDALTAALGRPGLRAGTALLAAGAPEVVVASPLLTVRLPGQPEVVWTAGGGIAGIASRAPRGTLAAAALHAAALLGVRAAAGIAPPVAAEVAAAAPAGPDPTFLDAVRAALLDTARAGFAAAPRALEDRLLDLAASSRADALPELAARLGRIAQDVRARRERAPDADAPAALAALAATYALTDGLRHGASPAAAREAPAPLDGALDLVGLGVEVWTTPSGARGVTAHLYAPERDRLFTATLARPAGADPAFEPTYAAGTLAEAWGRTLRQLGTSRLRLEGARATAAGRLQLSEGTCVSLAPLALAEGEAAGWLLAVADWSRLRSALAARAPGTPVLLIPQAAAQPRFDEPTQGVVLPLADARGVWLGVAATIGRSSRAALLTAIATTEGPPPPLLATSRAEGDRLALLPYATLPATGGVQSWDLPGGRLPDLGALGPRVAWALPATATPRLLATTGDELLGFCELGGHMADPDRAARLAVLGEAAARLGLDPLGHLLNAVATAVEGSARAGAVLRAAHAVTAVAALARPLPLLKA